MNRHHHGGGEGAFAVDSPIPGAEVLATHPSGRPLVVGVLAGDHLRVIARLAAERGSTLHFTGHGGDEVLGSPASYLHRLARRHPLVALDHIRGQRGRLLMITSSVQALIASLPASWSAPQTRDLVNIGLVDRWDALRWFLSLHYKFNGRLDTEVGRVRATPSRSA